MRYIASLTIALTFCASVASANLNITYNINTDVNRTPISKYIYGGNGQSGSQYTLHRSGGNRLTAYNWENNYSNAGADYGPYHNDDYMSSSTTPGKAISDFRDSCVKKHQDSIVTLQMAGYVSADKTGNVILPGQAAPSSRFKKAVFAKGAAFCSPPGNPDKTDANVYMDEFVNFLANKYGRAGEPNGVKFYCMDNEPDIWSDGNQGATHPEVHPLDPCCVEYKDKSVAISLAVKNVDPNAQMLGPVSYGFSGFVSFQGAADWPYLHNNYDPNWFLSYYLDKMEANSIDASKRLLDVLDVHWYPEAQDGAGNRITNDVNTTAMFNARMQAPRTLWDTGYVSPNGEISWINKSWNLQYLPLIPQLKKTITNYYPDTNLAFTEYDYGGRDHWSGGIAFADVLGIFGKYGVYIANYWGYDGNDVNAAFKIYRNYDGANSTFGDTEVYSTMSNKVSSSIYASVFDGHTDELHLVVINKNMDNAITGTFNITTPQNFRSGRAWKFDNNSYNITETSAISSISNNTFTYNIPATTVCHIVLQADPPSWDTTGPEGVPDGYVDIFDLEDFCNQWLQKYMFGHFASFGSDWGT